MLFNEYHQNVTRILDEIYTTQSEAVLAAATAVKNALKDDRLVYVFGCGHSNMMAEEAFYRAGGLAAVSPIFGEPLMLHEGAVTSSRLEKSTTGIHELLDSYPIHAGDVLFCVSTSGINAAAIEMALYARQKQMTVITITSSTYFQQPSNHPSKLHLWNACELWIDNKVPYGDACLSLDQLPTPFAPVSTIASTFILQSILAETIEQMVQDCIEPPIYLSGNIPGGQEHNQALIQKYAPRIRHLK